MLLCTFPRLLSLFPMPQRRRPAASSSSMPPPHRSRSGNFSAQTAASLHPSAALPPAASAGCPYQQLRHGAPASNKPHPAEKSTPVWLAIWRTWAGFANSQLLRAAFCSIYLNIGTHLPCCHLGAAAQTEQIFRPICTDCLRHLRISAE